MSEKNQRILLVLAVVVLSLGGIFIAAWVTQDAADGGRGGGIAVAFTLLAFFLRKDISTPLRKALTETLPQLERDLKALGATTPVVDADAAALAARVNSIQTILTSMETETRLNRTSERSLERAVALASVIATLAWTFGDRVAAALMS